MLITQDHLIRQISDREEINTATVRQILKSAEDIIFNCLSTTAPSEPVIIKPLQGIRIERNYIDKKNYSKGMFQHMTCPEHVRVKANSSKYFSGQVNKKLFSGGTKNEL